MFLIETSNEAKSAQTGLIGEKITVPAYLPRLSRSRLLSLLEDSLRSCNSTVISGRAGTGKTSLALDFARTCGRKVAWYKVDAPEAELEVFFQYLLASIGTQRPGFGSTLMPLVRALGPERDLAPCRGICLRTGGRQCRSVANRCGGPASRLRFRLAGALFQTIDAAAAFRRTHADYESHDAARSTLADAFETDSVSYRGGNARVYKTGDYRAV